MSTDLLIVISDFAYSARCILVTAFAHIQNNFARMALDQRDTKEWLRQIASYLNLSPSQLALNSGMAASTLTRYLNDKTNTIGITQSTLEKVAGYSGFRPHQFPGRLRPGFSEPDAVPFSQNDNSYPKWVVIAVENARSGRNGIDAWTMKSAALDGMGIMPGDILIIDQNKRPKTGDVVVAQILDQLTGTAETVIRLYQAPFILTHSMRMGPQRPEQVDEDRVSIAGTSIGSIRIPN
ncbi:LexA family transcriptional regulator [Rhizobium sp. 12,4]|uniref:LexA family transcriptional regulator n=1 Tax=Rhizobium sp. 12,4 TaxID=3405135 RepID=UPI003D328FD6